MAANTLLKLRTSTTTIEALDEALRPKTTQEGYAIQHQLTAALAAHYDSNIIGYKVGCTSEHAQTILHVDGPFYGRLFSHSLYESGVTLAADAMTHRVIEPELAFRVASDVPMLEGGYSAETILPYLSELIPAIEIVSPSYHDFSTVGAPSLIADNAVHGAVILGEPIASWQTLDLAAMQVALTINDDKVHHGISARALGSPLNVMAWLANELYKHGAQLKAGEVVITGVVTDVYSAEAGDHLHVEFDSKNTVSVTFS